MPNKTTTEPRVPKPQNGPLHRFSGLGPKGENHPPFFRLLVGLLAGFILAFPCHGQDVPASASGPHSPHFPTFRDYLKAAEKGHPLAQITIGYMYLDGHEVEMDPALAEEWFLKSANQGEPAAMMELGILYYQGRKTFPMNWVRAYAWMKMAAARFPPNEQKTWANQILARMETSLDTVQKGLAYDLFTTLEKKIPERPKSQSILRELGQ